MTNTQILVLLVILTVACLVAAVHFRYTQKEASIFRSQSADEADETGNG